MEQYLIDFIETLDALQKKVIQDVGDNPGFSRLTLSQFQYIDAIAALGEPSITEIATRLHITKASVTSGVNKLVSLGYVTKAQSKTDKRVYHVRLTLASQRMVTARYRALKAYGEFITTSLTEPEAQQFQTTLTKIVRLSKQV